MIDAIFGEFTTDELEIQISLFRRLHDRLEGFAEGVFSQTKSLDESATAAVTPAKAGLQRTNRFISY
ncbi:hypothetical protein D3C77_771300 [compost metagenome]